MFTWDLRWSVSGEQWRARVTCFDAQPPAAPCAAILLEEVHRWTVDPWCAEGYRHVPHTWALVAIEEVPPAVLSAGFAAAESEAPSELRRQLRGALQGGG